jgi:hypothetical protein
VLRMPAMTVAMARSLRSSVMPRWVQFQPMAARRRSMVETLLGFAPRSAAPEAQAVMYRPTTSGFGGGETDSDAGTRRKNASSLMRRRGACLRSWRPRHRRGRDQSGPEMRRGHRHWSPEEGRGARKTSRPRKDHRKLPCCQTALSCPERHFPGSGR